MSSVVGSGGLTVYTLAELDDLANGHRFSVFGGKVRENTGTKGDLLVKISFRETKVAELKLWGSLVTEVGVHDP